MVFPAEADSVMAPLLDANSSLINKIEPDPAADAECILNSIAPEPPMPSI